MPVLLDSSFIIALDNIDDVHHRRAQELWGEIESGDYGGAFISDHVFDEVLGVTLRKAGKARATMLGRTILNSLPLIVVDRHLFDEAWTLFTSTDCDFSFTDCTNVAIAGLIGNTAIATFDKEFKRHGTRVLD